MRKRDDCIGKNLPVEISVLQVIDGDNMGIILLYLEVFFGSVSGKMAKFINKMCLIVKLTGKGYIVGVFFVV